MQKGGKRDEKGTAERSRIFQPFRSVSVENEGEVEAALTGDAASSKRKTQRAESLPVDQLALPGDGGPSADLVPPDGSLVDSKEGRGDDDNFDGVDAGPVDLGRVDVDGVDVDDANYMTDSEEYAEGRSGEREKRSPPAPAPGDGLAQMSDPTPRAKGVMFDPQVPAGGQDREGGTSKTKDLFGAGSTMAARRASEPSAERLMLKTGGSRNARSGAFPVPDYADDYDEDSILDVPLSTPGDSDGRAQQKSEREFDVPHARRRAATMYEPKISNSTARSTDSGVDPSDAARLGLRPFPMAQPPAMDFHFRRGKKTERIEEIEDGGRILRRDAGRGVTSKLSAPKGRTVTKPHEQGSGFLKNTKISGRFLGPLHPSNSRKAELSDDDSDDDDDDGEFEYEESDDDDDDSLANFDVRLEEGSLSEGSFIRVASEYELDTDHFRVTDNLFFDKAENESKADLKLSEAGSRFPHKQSRILSHMERVTVLDCIVRLLAGTRVTKQIRFGRVRDRWIYLGTDLATLNWRSSKKSKDIEGIVLKKVRSIQIRDRSLVVRTRTYRMKVMLETREEAKSWLTGLVRLIPSTAEVMDGNMMVEMPELYDPLKDAWRGKPVESCKRINNCVLLGDVGHGSFGKVKLALSVTDKKFYAVKIIADPGKLKRLMLPSEREASARLKKLHHPHVVRHRDILYNQEKQKVVYVLEYMSRGVVQDCTKLENNKPMDEDQVRAYTRDVVSGLLYLHKHGIVHRDIKPANLLRSGDGRVKISDFGEAKFYNLRLKEDKENTGVPGTPAFLAPEFCVSAHCPKGNASHHAVDIWSLGASIYYLVFGSVPFVAKSILAMYDAICTEELKFPAMPKVSAQLKDLLKRMMTKSPQKRILLKDVAEHPWFGVSRPTFPNDKPIVVTDEEIENAVQEAKWIYPDR